MMGLSEVFDWQNHWCLVKEEILVTLSCLTLCDPMDCSPPGSSVHRTVQAGILEGYLVTGSKPDVLLLEGFTEGKETG